MIERTTWKALAIVFMILFWVETILVLWGLVYIFAVEEKEYECLYDVCGEHAYAEFDDPICYCYEYDVFGELILDKTEYMK